MFSKFSLIHLYYPEQNGIREKTLRIRSYHHYFPTCTSGDLRDLLYIGLIFVSLHFVDVGLSTVERGSSFFIDRSVPYTAPALLVCGGGRSVTHRTLFLLVSIGRDLPPRTKLLLIRCAGDEESEGSERY